MTILSDLFNSDDQLNKYDGIQDKIVDETNTEDSANALPDVTCDVDADEEENKTSATTQSVTIGLTGFCNQNVSGKIIPIFNKYKGYCHKRAAALLLKNTM